MPGHRVSTHVVIDKTLDIGTRGDTLIRKVVIDNMRSTDELNHVVLKRVRVLSETNRALLRSLVISEHDYPVEVRVSRPQLDDYEVIRLHDRYAKRLTKRVGVDRGITVDAARIVLSVYVQIPITEPLTQRHRINVEFDASVEARYVAPSKKKYMGEFALRENDPSVQRVGIRRRTIDRIIGVGKNR